MTRIAILGGGPAGMLAALLAHRSGAKLCWVSGGPDAPQTPHIHLLRPEITTILGQIDARLGALIAAETDQNHLWRGVDGAPRLAPRLSRVGLLRALRTRLAEAGLHPIVGDADDLAKQHRHDPTALWIDATGGARALCRLFESTGQGQLHLEDVGRCSVWQTSFWPDYACDAPFTHIVPGQHYTEASSLGLRITGCGARTADFPTWMAPPEGQPAMTWRFIAPPIRIAIWTPAHGAPNLVLLGDALLQTPPSMGFGLLGVAQQTAILSETFATRLGSGPELETWAQNLWSSAAMQEALQTLPA